MTPYTNPCVAELAESNLVEVEYSGIFHPAIRWKPDRCETPLSDFIIKVEPSYITGGYGPRHIKFHRHQGLKFVPTVIEINLIDKYFFFPIELKEIAEGIEASRYLLNLEEGWDEEEGKKIEPKIWKSAMTFLAVYATTIKEDSEKVIKVPEINPCKDGSIDLEWETKNARMLINIRESEDEIRAFYYGDLHNLIKPIKGWVPVDPIDYDFANWMKKLTY
jgi:hypothetical protein